MGPDRRPAGKAVGLRTRRRAVLHVRTAARDDPHRRTQHGFLPPLPALTQRLVAIVTLSVAFVAMTMAIAAGIFTTLDHEIALAMREIWQEPLNKLVHGSDPLGGMELTTV